MLPEGRLAYSLLFTTPLMFQLTECLSPLKVCELLGPMLNWKSSPHSLFSFTPVRKSKILKHFSTALYLSGTVVLNRSDLSEVGNL